MSAPLTSRKLGSTRCPYCEQLFADGDDIVELEATDFTGARPGYLARNEIRVMRRWHRSCIETFEQQNAQLRADDQAARDEMVAEIRAVIEAQR